MSFNAEIRFICLEKNLDDSSSDNDIIGHSLSWSWEENETSWSPTPITDPNEVEEANSDNKTEKTEISSEASFPKVSKSKRRRVRAKIWCPKFPGERSSENSLSKNNDVITLSEEIIFAGGTAIPDNNEQSFFRNHETADHTAPIPHLHVPDDQYIAIETPASSESLVEFTNFQDYSLPPVSSLFETSTASEAFQTNATITDNTFSVNDVVISEQNSDYSFQHFVNRMNIVFQNQVATKFKSRVFGPLISNLCL